LAAMARAADHVGRRLPRWRGCHQLAKNQVFFLSPLAGSFDGRYFGPADTETIIGRAQTVRFPSI
jgi:type IV secretory pathway protease TraF